MRLLAWMDPNKKSNPKNRDKILNMDFKNRELPPLPTLSMSLALSLAAGSRSGSAPNTLCEPVFTPGIKEIYTISESLTNKKGQQEQFRLETYIPASLEDDDDSVEMQEVDLVVANGGGGQVGMLGHLTHSYMISKYLDWDSYKPMDASKHSYLDSDNKPIDSFSASSRIPKSKRKTRRVAWYASNTNDSHDAVQRGVADIAIVYDVDRVAGDIKRGVVEEDQVVHCWMDRCCIIGPVDFVDDCAGGFVGGGVERVLRGIMGSKRGYFMTRVDESTSHVKERAMVSCVIAKIRQEFGMERMRLQDVLDMYVYMGYTKMPEDMQRESHVHFTMDQVQKCLALLQRDQCHPRYTEYVKAVRPDFYRPLRLMPLQAACKANQIGSFLLSDYGIFRHLPRAHKNKIKVLMDGTEAGLSKSDRDFFLNPAVAIMSSKSVRKDHAKAFMDFLRHEQTQTEVVPAFKAQCGTSYFESPFTDWFRRRLQGLDLGLKKKLI